MTDPAAELPYRYDPELVPLVPMLPTAPPPSPASGVAEAIAKRETSAAYMATLPAPVLPDGVTVEDLTVPGPAGAPDVPIRLYRAAGANGSTPGVVNIHGGGFYTGSVFQGETGAAGTAATVGGVVVDVEYRLAPEQPAPAAVEDCYAALCWFHEHAAELGVDPDRIAVSGGSAGGGIAAGLALYARDCGGPPICFQFLMIPELDHRLETPSMRAFGDTPMWNHHQAEESWRWYLGGASGDDVSPYASPSVAPDLGGLPPAYISVMEFDPLRDEGIHYALRLLEAGVGVELHLFPGTFHGSSLFSHTAVAQRESLERTVVMRRALGVD